MTSWAQRSREERALLNPGFCANMLWHAARGYAGVGSGALSFEESFLVLPFVLHRNTREALPRNTRTSLAVWLNENPLARGRITSRARLLVTFTKEAMTFGGVRGLIRIDDGRLHAEEKWKRSVDPSLRGSSDEVRECAKRAEFVGKWFALAGNALTVLALMGVRP
jgi:hypothetical protein